MTGRLARALLLGTAILAGCGGSAATPVPPAVTPTPVASATIAPVTAIPDQIPTPVPSATLKPRPTPKPLYSVVWLRGACVALGDLAGAINHLAAVRVYLSSGDWGAIRLEDFSATQETIPAIQALSDDWKPGREFNSEVLGAAIAVQHAASQWDLAATFMTVGASTDAASATLDAVTQANVAAAHLAALGKKYHFTCADV